MAGCKVIPENKLGAGRARKSWVFGVHWDALVAVILLVSAHAYMANRRGRRAREAMGALLSDRF
jgi:hypothetical protein